VNVKNLKEIVARLESLGAVDGQKVVVKMLDGSEINLHANAFEVVGQNAAYNKDASQALIETVTEQGKLAFEQV